MVSLLLHEVTVSTSEWGITCLSPTQTNQSFVSGSCIIDVELQIR